MNVAAAISETNISGPYFKDETSYISKDGDNPEAPWPGYGWPLETECWWFAVECGCRRVIATGLTHDSAIRRAVLLASRLARPEE
jgi:hypothetical protein